MNNAGRGILVSDMDEHLDEYLLFHDACRSNKRVDASEIPMLWETWCIRTKEMK